MKRQTEHLSIRLNFKQYKQILETLKKEGMTKSELVRLALANYLEKS
jgi:predicted DNA-binding protein